MNKARMMVWWVLEVQAQTHGVETSFLIFAMQPKRAEEVAE